MTKDFNVKILRFDPSADPAPYYREYDVPWIEDGSNIVSALQVLKYINENIEPITFDSCCYSSICGRCSIMIDGVAALACVTPLEPGRHTFEPLKGFSVIRDLTVETDKAYDQFVNSVMENQTINTIDPTQTYDYNFYWEILDRLNACRECLCCYAACSALQDEGKWDAFVGPGAMMQIGLRYLDGRDQSDRVLQAVTSGLYQCTLCGECADVCSSHIDILGVMQVLRKAAVARDIVPADAVDVNYRVSGMAPEVTYTGTDAEGVIASSTCSQPECHDSAMISRYKRDTDLAALRVDSHAKRKANVTDAQTQALKEYFVKQG